MRSSAFRIRVSMAALLIGIVCVSTSPKQAMASLWLLLSDEIDTEFWPTMHYASPFSNSCTNYHQIPLEGSGNYYKCTLSVIDTSNYVALAHDAETDSDWY